VPPLGALGAATGAIAIGTAATSTSITTIISTGTSTRTPTGTLTEVKLAKATNGSITRSTEETLRTAIEEQRINLAATIANSQEAAIVQAAVPVLERAPVAGEPERGRVAAERERDRVAGELERGRVAGELEHDLVAAALERDRVVELERGQVVGELEHAPAEAAALGHLLARVAAVPLRIKWVIAARRPGQVPLLAAEEDSVVAAETMLEPVAAEAAVAWEAAV
jgi:hypothetical protein